tara:strand:- start:2205 stop:2876 length:672 start_codon:yes stop_codon:yes gene_type:complete
VVITIVAALVPSLAAAKDSGGAPTVQVTTTGSVAHEPNRVRLLLSVETFASRAEDAARENATRMKAVYKGLYRLGLTRNMIQTVSYSLDPRFDHSKRQSPEPVGYSARNRLQVTLDSLALVGKLIDTAIASGANRATELQFELKDSDEARLGALRAAMTRARAHARALAEAAGKRLGSPINIVTTPGGPVPRMAKVQSMRSFDETPIEGGAVHTSATVTFLLK